MTRTVRIPVPGGLQTHQGIISEIVLKEPDLDTYLELGEPVTYARAPDGSLFTVEVAATIRAYLERCLVSPKDPLLLSPGGMALGRALKNAVLGFFLGEASADEPSKTSPTTSSSPPVKDGSTPQASAS